MRAAELLLGGVIVALAARGFVALGHTDHVAPGVLGVLFAALVLGTSWVLAERES